MIKVEFTHQTINGFNLAVSGHAGYDDNGKDIVCAGVSAIVQSLAVWLDNIPSDCLNGKHIDIGESGHAVVNCTAKAHFIDKVKTAYSVVLIGLLSLSGSYPDNIKVNSEEISDFLKFSH